MQSGEKPGRSDVDHLTPEELAIHEQKLKEFLDSSTPVRTLKPSRSEASELLDASDALPAEVSKAELERFQSLEAEDDKLHTEGGVVNDDSYVQTEYYDDLNAVDKSSHHTTGTGFIKSDAEIPVWHLKEDEADPAFKTCNGTNPATNEWEPSPPVDISIDSKVHRSDP
ncbi:hypothetical protein MPTK1_1g11190 [Marchantia polymorpha subsp. ruderalis]|uniref:Uncharacterized protein n=2 Tax=Marchantia polymorpha TaxID=3197 RepID=A0AAF6ANX7_MARPO|nr:hypothetical protein MARPO_0014s0108 [Marchantia polymorpha]BBM98147.1 hypothetical protein Mp_1g11190 [Marchantia polymorpha subsp. ruderalis]|eukprot:PTQ45578.1 hypothetical protein MARPO_0014s0108 [Marchantia polymorpha]